MLTTTPCHHNFYKRWILQRKSNTSTLTICLQIQAHMLVSKWNCLSLTSFMLVDPQSPICILVCTVLTSRGRKGPMRARTRVIFLVCNKHFNTQNPLHGQRRISLYSLSSYIWRKNTLLLFCIRYNNRLLWCNCGQPPTCYCTYTDVQIQFRSVITKEMICLSCFFQKYHS